MLAVFRFLDTAPVRPPGAALFILVPVPDSEEIKSLDLVRTFKGIVSRDFEGLQIILMDRSSNMGP